MGLNLKSLIGKLNEQTRGALEAAAGLCLSRTHYDIEIEHLLLKMLDSSSNDFASILKHFEVDKSRLAAELTRSLDKLKSGNARTPAISPSVLKTMTTAWTIGSIDYNAGQVRTGFVILALVTDAELTRLINEVSREFQKINGDALHKDLYSIVAMSAETTTAAAAAGSPAAGQTPTPGGKTPNLDQYTVNLTGNAKGGQDRPGAGPRFRDPPDGGHPDAAPPEQPHPHRRSGRGQDRRGGGLRAAHRAGRRAAGLRNVTVRTLDLALLQAGAGVKGEFENRLKGLIEEVKSSPTPIILFIDEAHTMIGAGGAGRPERRGQPAEAGAGARRTAHHRRHHLVRVQEVLRKGSGAGAALPGGQGGGARPKPSAW
jgi:type VI secretion system protein VasG